jgi:rod shape-determining protein MreD
MAATLIFGAALFLAAALQTALFRHLQLPGGVPDLVVVLIVSIGLTRGAPAGVGAGLFGGFLRAAALEGTPFGGLLVSHMLVGYLAGKLRGRVFADRLVVVVLVAAVAVAFSELVQFVFRPPPDVLSWMARTAVAIAYSVIVAPLVHAFVRLVNLRFPSPLGE